MGRGGGGIYDEGMAYKFGYDRVWACQMQGLGANGVTLGNGGAAAISEVLESGGGTTTEYEGVAMAAAAELYFLLNPRKWDCDFTRDIQVLLGLASGVAGTAIFSVAARGCAVGQAPNDAKVTPDGAVTYGALTIPQYLLTETPWASLGVPGAFVGDSIIACAITIGAVATLAETDVRLIYADFRYSVSLCDPNGPFQT